MLRYYLIAFLYICSFVEAANVPYIAGGQAADIKDFQCVVQVLDRGSYRCCAVIISPHWAVTQAQCVEGIRNIEYLTLREGSSKLNEGGTIRTAATYKMHELYDPVYFDHDLAVIEVTEAFTSLPCQIADAESDCAGGVTATACGWGYTNDKGPLSDTLRSLKVPLIGNDVCSNDYPEQIVNERSLCLTDAGGKGACLGDAGCPVFSAGKVCGTASWAYGCGKTGYPSVYARLSAYKSWIQQNSGV